MKITYPETDSQISLADVKLEQLKYIEKLNIDNQKPEYLVIWLHGLGADGNDFVPIIPELKLSYCVKFIFPNAPLIPITINDGNIMQGWYDIRDLTRLGNAVDRQGINVSVAKIEALIDSFIDGGWKSNRIVIAGFSQGGVIAYTVALKSKYKLGGALVLSSYFPDVETLAKEKSVNKKIPILACHGKQDMIVPYNAGLEAYNTLRVNGFNISWLSYPMDHGLCYDEIRDISLWLQDRFI